MKLTRIDELIKTYEIVKPELVGLLRSWKEDRLRINAILIDYPKLREEIDK